MLLSFNKSHPLKSTTSPFCRKTTSRLCFLLLGIFSTAALAQSETTTPIRYLGVGNSFTRNATEYLDEMAAASGRPIEYHVAYIGGASLERHMQHVDAHEANPNDPDGKPFGWPTHSSFEKRSLLEILQSKSWDIISIQQVSKFSFRPETYEPYATKLIKFIRTVVPDAEIVVHMTWAYRADHKWFVEGTMSQHEMAEGLIKSYHQLAKNHDLRIVPVGVAFQLARQSPSWNFTFPDPDFDYEHPEYPALPNQNGGLNVGWTWDKNAESAQPVMRHDPNHANDAGCFLGSLIWYQFLTGESFDPKLYHPKSLSLSAAQDLTKHANEAMRRPATSTLNAN